MDDSTEPAADRRRSGPPPRTDVLDAVEAAMVRIRRSQSRGTLARLSLEQAGGEGRSGNPSVLTLFVVDAVDAGPGESGDVTVGLVAERLGVDPSRASRAVAEAVRTGHVRRAASQADGRRSCLELTGSGREAAAAAHRSRQDFYAELLDGWSSREQTEFARLLGRFVAALDTKADGA
ncbi:MarR family winged helix-turn-helix transcriptional regulator [Streptomyces xiaopingdaonensis]|uniref:MarR family winged helix-turn-helix transcriptional regulator n=1 Tax=Streptomyces xiaopingdaonensis TaxID=1565415 RepID=UPI0002F68AD5|nr:MarR family winged helix-turn-helix transcriptional regulator [Streptomyces xiaopingdaonensis]